MRKLRISAVLLGVIALSSIVCTNIYAEDPEIPSGGTDGGLIITCRCTRDISFKPQACAVNNHGIECHASENAKCWEYDKNCNGE